MDNDLKHLHQDLKDLKRDISLIKHILIEEGQLKTEAKERLLKARETPDSEYSEL